jgi:hypothetical protein
MGLPQMPGLDWSCRHRYRSIPGLNRLIGLRRRLGADLRPFSPLPAGPIRRLKDKRLVLEIERLEAGLVGHLREDINDVLERRHASRRRRSRG